MSVITALTAQNTTGVSAIHAVPPEFVAAQLDAVFTDIVPDAVKIGMVCNSAIAAVIADKLVQYEAKNIVIDPVMVATSGSSLLDESAADTLVTRLFPLATLITPNIPEAEKLGGAANIRGNVLLKGGHLTDSADDTLWQNGSKIVISGERIDNPNTHGTGCTLSSAIAANLANGLPLEEAVRQAKAYITAALKAGLDLGRGSGPLWHGNFRKFTQNT
jgi:hydroxymethylpyrimidine/phosphomethylpyrimidine kinase